MPLPSLIQFLTPLPSYPLSTPLPVVCRSLQQGELEHGSHIIVVDAMQRPVGTIPVMQLWAMVQQSDWKSSKTAITPPESLAEGHQTSPPVAPCLDCLQDFIQPVMQVTVNQEIADLWGSIHWTSDCPLVVVNDQMQYIGVVSPEALLNWLSTRMPLTAKAEPPHPATDPANSQPALGSPLERLWLIELSHALKTPMTSLLGLSSLLLDSRVGSLNERQTRYVGLVRQSVRRLIRTVNQLLDWLRLESGQMLLQPREIALQPWATDLWPALLNDLADLSVASEVASHFQVTVDLPQPYIRVDAPRLRQSLFYCMEYLLKSGVRPQGLEIIPWGTWVGLTLWVATKPVGLPLLMRHMELHGVSANAPPDSNLLDTLGLVLACRLIDLLGGEVTYLTSPRWGTRLTFLLPMVKVPQEPMPQEPVMAGDEPVTDVAETAQPAPGPPQPINSLVLLICHRPSLIDQVYESLSAGTYALVIARSRADALAKGQRLTPDLLILDAEAVDESPSQFLAALGAIPCESMVVIATAPPPPLAQAGTVISPERLSQELLPLVNQLLGEDATALLAPPAPLTLLWLRPQTCLSPLEPSPLESTSESASPVSLYDWLQQFNCRLLQVDDLAQANLLSRVWQPDAVILDANLPLSETYLTELSHQADLAHRPLMTLNPPMTALAHQVPDLWVVACTEATTLPPRQGAITLLAAITAMREVTQPGGTPLRDG
jgi:CheY-like chemotaxis protein